MSTTAPTALAQPLPGPYVYDPETGMIETASPVDLSGAYGHVCDLRPASFGTERGTFDHATGRLLAAAPDLRNLLRQCETRFERIASGELSGMAAKHSAKSALESLRYELAKLEGRA